MARPILYIHSGDWPSSSPSVVFVTGTVYGLARIHPTTLIVKNNSAEASPDVFRAITGDELPSELEIVRIGSGRRPPGHSAFYRAAAREIGRRARRGDVGAVITRSIGFLPYLLYCRKRWGVPVYFETHDFFTDLSFRSDLEATLRVRKNSLYERLFLPRLNGLICLTDSQASLFERWYPNVPAAVARTGLFRVTANDAPRERSICYVGSLDGHKGLSTVLEALSLTGDSDLSLVVIGGKSEHEMESFRKLARLMGVGARVRITGWLSHADVGSVMDRCLAGVVPLHDTPFNRLITSPLKILDCFSRCLPVLASDLPMVHEFVEDGVHGCLFSPGDSEALAAAIDRFTVGEMFKSCSRAVAERAPNFLWERRAESILSFLSSQSSNESTSRM